MPLTFVLLTVGELVKTMAVLEVIFPASFVRYTAEQCDFSMTFFQAFLERSFIDLLSNEINETTLAVELICKPVSNIE